MEVIHIILTLLLGALIGYVTNYIAVKMLFRPYRAVKLGGRALPFTPGVIPKNKSRIAKACGTAVEGSLFSKEDIKDAITGSLQNIDIGNIEISEILDEPSSDKIAQTLTDKLTEEIKSIDIKTLIVEKGGAVLEDKVKGTMLAMFVNKDMISSFAEPIEQKAMQYIDGEGAVYINLRVRQQIDEIRNRTVRQEAEVMDIDIKAITNKFISEFASGGLENIISGINISAIVEDKINRMDVREFEKLVLSVMKKELQAVVNLGALIGFIIGLINLVI